MHDVPARHGRPPAASRSVPSPRRPVPTHCSRCIRLDFLELPVARSGHDFLKVHINLLTRHIWLAPTSKTAAEEAARSFVGSVFRDVGLPDVLVSDRDTRFTSACWTGLHAALGKSLIIWY